MNYLIIFYNSEEYLNLNPLAQNAAIEHNGNVMTQSVNCITLQILN